MSNLVQFAAEIRAGRAVLGWSQTELARRTAVTRLQWDVTKSFYLGVEIVYEHLDSASSATGTLPAGISLGSTVAANRFVSVGGSAENVWVGTFRMHKDFLP